MDGMRSTRRRYAFASAALVAALVVAFGLYWFQPWKLFTHSHVDEALPGYSTPSAAAATPGATTGTTSTSSTAPTSAAVASVLSRSAFRSGEHRTSGTALLIRLADGRLVVRLEDFSTSDGPDVRVVLASTTAGSSGVGSYHHLGHLKATSGNQNYPVATGTDVSGYRSVVIWCKRFNAVFGSAELIGS